MGAIKDLVDLVTQLNNSVENRKFAGELREIQSMIGSLQSEHAKIHEQRIELMTENAELKQTIAALREEVSALKSQKDHLKEAKINGSPSIIDEEAKILIFLAKHNDVSANQIAHSLGFDLTKTEYWLERLTKREMIDPSYIMNRPVEYSLIQAGREYLIENELI